MKRIVNGVTYNTETATRLAEARWEDDEGEVLGILYQTRGGAFFVDTEVTSAEVWNEDDRKYERAVKHAFRPLSPEQAHKWIMDGDVEVFRNPFEDPPEAAAEAEPGATIYVRVPASLKRSVDKAAGEAGVSGNVWAMRCVERCLAGMPVEMVCIWNIARGLTAPWSDDKYGKDAALDSYKFETAERALDKISDLVEDFARRQFGSDDLTKIPSEIAIGDHKLQELSNAFRPYPK
jgi:hypothetical protein